ncbi:hypothetical protein SDC9_174472 [bioreactor metagenome]|uniref:Uncharacterized protein n=1 Tax=bioreactor metagenome TaxID=1076179 RepID=A0A645GK05_9ZZZZ
MVAFITFQPFADAICRQLGAVQEFDVSFPVIYDKFVCDIFFKHGCVRIIEMVNKCNRFQVQFFRSLDNFLDSHSDFGTAGKGSVDMQVFLHEFFNVVTLFS